jgi:hypothetical protein
MQQLIMIAEIQNQFFAEKKSPNFSDFLFFWHLAPSLTSLNCFLSDRINCVSYDEPLGDRSLGLIKSLSNDPSLISKIAYHKNCDKLWILLRLFSYFLFDCF